MLSDDPPLPCYDDFGYYRENAMLSWKAGNELDLSPQKIQENSKSLAYAYEELKKYKYHSHIVDLDEAIQNIDLITNNVGLADEYLINEFMRSLVQKYPDASIQPIVSGMFPEGLWSANYLRRLSSVSGEAKTLRKANLILLPINREAHWTIVGIKKYRENYFNIYCADGFNRQADHEVFFERAKDFLTHLYSNQDLRLQFHSIGIPMQNNNFDCGYIACIVADRLAKGEEGIKQLQSFAYFQYEHCNYQASRSVVLQRLVEYSANIIQAYTHEVIVNDNSEGHQYRRRRIS